jgi:hypothetical protein
MINNARFTSPIISKHKVSYKAVSTKDQPDRESVLLEIIVE